MLNLNSVFSEGLKYNIKWHLPLTKTSVGESSSEWQQEKKECSQDSLPRERVWERCREFDAFVISLLPSFRASDFPFSPCIQQDLGCC